MMGTSELYCISLLLFYCMWNQVFSSVFQAYVVLGQFLVLKKDEEIFVDWLKETCQSNKKQSNDCYGCLKDWCDAFL